MTGPTDSAGGTPALTYEILEARRLATEGRLPDDLGLRLRRSLSWLDRAEKEMSSGDHDAAFIFLLDCLQRLIPETALPRRLARVTRKGTLHRVLPPAHQPGLRRRSLRCCLATVLRVNQSSPREPVRVSAVLEPPERSSRLRELGVPVRGQP